MLLNVQTACSVAMRMNQPCSRWAWHRFAPVLATDASCIPTTIPIENPKPQTEVGFI